ncbi:MAG: D-alanyl-D-alanine dipeptidase [Aliidongia sp.]
MLIEIAKHSHKVLLEIRYATEDNFTGRPVYARPGCYLNPEAEALLCRAVALAQPLGLTLKLFDTFRPSEAQWQLWNHTPDPEFLADPRRGSPHSRGAAVDLTLVDASGAELDMGTGFDAFTPLSHHGNTEILPAAQRNRLLLMGLMSTAGWDFYRNEWWHYQLFQPRRFPVLSDTVLVVPMMGGMRGR